MSFLDRLFPRKQSIEDFKAERQQWLSSARIDGLPIDPNSEFGKSLKSFEAELAALRVSAPTQSNALKRIQCLQDELSLVALELARVLNEQNSDKIQAEKYRDFMKTCGDPVYFGRWLNEKFKGDWIALREQGMTILQVAQELLERYRQR